MGNIESEKSWTLLEDLIQKAGGCAVIDGGFATQLERHGASINDPLWSALCLIKDSHLVKKVLSLLFFLPVVVFAFLCRSRSWSEIFFLRFIWNTWRPVQIYWSLRLTRLICEFPLSLLGVFYFFFWLLCEMWTAFVLFPTVSGTKKKWHIIRNSRKILFSGDYDNVWNFCEACLKRLIQCMKHVEFPGLSWILLLAQEVTVLVFLLMITCILCHWNVRTRQF